MQTLAKILPAVAITAALASPGPLVAAEPTSDDQPVEMTLRVQPVDRLIQLGATLLRDAGAGDFATDIAVKARVVAAAIKLDTTRPVTLRAALLPSETDEPNIDPESIAVVWPTPLKSTEIEQGRIRFSDEGVRIVDETGELDDAEFYVSAADRWALLTKSLETAVESRRVAAVERFENSPEKLIEFHITNGVIPTADKEKMVTQLWKDITRDLKRQNDEPNDIYALRREIQTATGQLIEATLTELDTISLVADASDDHDVDAELRIAWSPGTSIASSLDAIQPIETKLAGVMNVPTVSRLRSHFRLPRPASRRLARWLETAGQISVSLAEQADRTEFLPLVTAVRDALRPAVSEGRVDFFVDCTRVDNYLAINAGVAIPGREVLQSSLELLGRDVDGALPIRSVGDSMFVRIGEPGQKNKTPLGPNPEFWLGANDSAIWMVVGQSDAVDAFGERLEASTRTAVASPGVGRPGRTLTGSELAWWTIDTEEARVAFQAFPNDAKATEIAGLLALIPPEESVFSVVATADDGSLKIASRLAGEIVEAVVTAIVDKEKGR